MTEDKKGRLFVAVQYIIIVLLLVSTDWQLFNAMGLLCLCSSFSIAVRSFIVMRLGTFNIRPALKSQSKLVTSGPYRYIRHPMYVSVFLGCGGLVATSYDVLRIGLFMILCTALYSKAVMEEKILLATFPEYEKLQEKTGMFIPWL